MSNDEIVSQLVSIYYKYESWQEDPRMGRENAFLYHRTLYENGAIECASEGNIVVGYTETWRLSFDQLGRLVCGKPFSAMQEDVRSGPVAWLANIFILPEHRNGAALKTLRLKFFGKNRDCEYFAGNKVKRSSAPFQILTRSKLLKAREVM